MEHKYHIIWKGNIDYFQTDNGLNIDTGAFIAGLEYVTSTSSHVIGKPSKSFFDLAIKDFDLPYNNIPYLGIYA